MMLPSAFLLGWLSLAGCTDADDSSVSMATFVDGDSGSGGQFP
jgi:hypothetical protein